MESFKKYFISAISATLISVIFGGFVSFIIAFSAQGVSSKHLNEVEWTIFKAILNIWIVSFAITFVILGAYFEGVHFWRTTLRRILAVSFFVGAYGYLNYAPQAEVRNRHVWLSPDSDAVEAQHFGWPFRACSIWKYASGRTAEPTQNTFATIANISIGAALCLFILFSRHPRPTKEDI